MFARWRGPLLVVSILVVAVALGGSVGGSSAQTDPSRAELDRSLDDPDVRRLYDEWRKPANPPAPEHPPFDEIPEVQELRKAEDERAAALARPERKAERLASRTADRGLARTGAERLATQTFPGLFSGADRRLLPLAAGDKVARYTSESSAVVEGPHGRSVVDSSVPLRAADAKGDPQPVDFELQRTAAGWEPVNGLVPIAFGEGPSQAIELGEDFAVGFEGATVPGTRTANEIFFPAVAQDVDAWAGPTPLGGRVAFQLRSADSPEEVRLSVSGGATPSVVGDTDAVEMLRDGKRVGTMSAPVAFDADGTPVELAVRVEGTSIVIAVPHRTLDLHYPIAVDPVLEDQDSWKFGNPNTAGWQWNSNAGVPFPHSFTTGPFGTGFYVDRPTGQALQSSWFGEWQYPAMNVRSYIHQADFLHPAHTAFETTNGIGMWSTYDGNFQHFYAKGAYNLAGGSITVCADGAVSAAACDETVDIDQSKGNYVLSSISTDKAATWAQPAQAYFGGARIWMSDWEDPELAYWIDAPTDWVHDTPSGPYNGINKAHVRIADNGLGLWGLTMDVPGLPLQTATDFGGCTGTHSSPCPWSRAENFSYIGMSEGRQTVTATGEDVLGKKTAFQKTLKIDRSPPALDFRGSTLHQGGETLTSPSYTLKVKATDGSRATPAQERSGVRAVEVWTRRESNTLDTDSGKGRITYPAGTTNDGFVRKDSFAAVDCTHAQGSCERTETWNVNTSSFAPGEHRVRVVAKDQLAVAGTNGWKQAGPTGHAVYKDFAIFVPEPVTERPADRIGLEQWWDYDTTDTGAGTTANINLSTGSAVWHSTPVVNTGRGLSTLVNLTYNSFQRVQLPLLETPHEQLYTPYAEAGNGFSLGISGMTRLNERMNVDLAPSGRVTFTDADGTRHTFKAESAGSDVFKAPPGVQLHLRRFAKATGVIDAPFFGFEQLDTPAKAWAATRPDGVTYYFDRLGYQTSIEDRNGNALTFAYEYRGPTRDACIALNSPVNLNVFYLPGKLCQRKVVKVTDAGGRDLTVAYEPRTLSGIAPEMVPDEGLPPALVGQTAETAAYASGRVKTITDHGGRVLELEYDGSGNLTSMTQAKGTTAQRAFQFGYEAPQSGLKIRPLTTITDPRGNATTIEYEPRTSGGDSLTPLLLFDREICDIRDRSDSPGTDTNIDVQGNTWTRVQDARNQVTMWRTDSRGRTVEIIDPLSTKTLLTWDDATTNDNNVIKVTEAAGTADEAVTDMSYNANGMLLTQKDPQAQVDPGRGSTVLTYTDSPGHSSHQSPRETGGTPIDAGRTFVSDLATAKDPRGTTITFGYSPDGRGNLTSRSDPEGFPAATMTYGANGVLATEKDESGSEWKYSDHDANGLPETVKDPRDKIWRYDYDALGNTTCAADPRATPATCSSTPGVANTTRLTYDALDRQTEEVVPKDGTFFITRSRTYDANSNPATEVDGNSQTTTYTWSKMDVLRSVKTPSFAHAVGGTAQEVTTWDYDAEDNPTVVTAPSGTASGTADDFTTATTFDAINRPVVVNRRSRGSVVKDLKTSYAYDRRDNVVGMVDPLRNEKFSGSSPETNAATPARRRFTFEYDKADNRTAAVEDPGGLVLRSEYAYDPNDNLVSIVDPRAFKAGGAPAQYTTAFGYDKRDHLIDVTDAQGQRTHFTLRGDGLVKEAITPRGIADGGNGTAFFKTVYDYFATKELKERTLPKAPNQYAPAAPSVKYEINDVGDPEKITDARGNSFTNTFFETGEIKSTGRPSWWKASPSIDAPSAMPSAPVSGPDPVGSVPVPSPNMPGAYGGGDVRERSDGEGPSDDGGAGGLPGSSGFGDFGGVDPEPAPTLVQRAGSTKFNYDGEMRLNDVEDALGHHTTVTYDPVGRVTQVKRPLEISTSRYVTHDFGYDLNGNNVRTTRPASWQKADGSLGNLVTNRTYDQFDRRTQLDAPGNASGTRELTIFGYDANDRVVSRQTPRGAAYTWAYTYDDVDRMTVEDNPGTSPTNFAYDPAGNRTLITTPRGKQWDPEYDSLNQLASIKDPAGKVTSYTYDENGNQTRVDRPGAAESSGGSIETQTVRSTFDGRDLPWARTVGEGGNARTTVTEYDENGNLRRSVNPAGVDQPNKVAKNAWDGQSITVSSDAAENATVRRYDSDDVLTSVHLAFGDIDGAGPAPSESKRWRMDFQPGLLGRVRFANSPYNWSGTCSSADGSNEACPNQTEYERFDGGWIKSVSKSKAVTQGVFDATTVDELVFDYDRRGHQTLWRTPKDVSDRRIIKHQYDPNGTLVLRRADQTGDKEIRSYSYEYSPNHALTKFTDKQLSRATSMEYDAAERLTMVDETWSSEPAKARDTLVRYDDDSNITHRLTDGVASGNVVAAYSGGKTTSFGYDDLGRETSMWVCASGGATCDPGAGASPTRTTTSTYWDSSQVKARTKPNGVVESMYFVNDGRLTQMVRKKGATTLKDQSYVYDNNGNRAKDERGTHRFNARNQLRRWVRSEAAGSGKPAGSAVEYTVNGAGAITERDFITDPSKADPPSRTEDYAYDGDRLTKVTADTPSTSPTDALYCYDPTGFGEVRRIEDGPNCPADLDAAISGQDTKFKYDDLSRMTNARGAGQEDDVKYTYDGLDRRDRRFETIGGTEKSLEYYYVGLGESLSGEQDSGAVKAKTYDYNSLLQRQGQQTKTSSSTKYRSYATDANGSVEGLEDADGKVEDCSGGSPPPGCKSDRYRYEPYGDIEGAEGDLSDEAKDNPFRFQGFYYDSAVGVYDMQARAYQPSVGRFLSEDHYQSAEADLALLSDPVTSSRYAFAGGNPIDGIEFDGHYSATSGPGSRHIATQGGGTYDRQTGTHTSGPLAGQGPGGGSDGDTGWRPTVDPSPEQVQAYHTGMAAPFTGPSRGAVAPPPTRLRSGGGGGPDIVGIAGGILDRTAGEAASYFGGQLSGMVETAARCNVMSRIAHPDCEQVAAPSVAALRQECTRDDPLRSAVRMSLCGVSLVAGKGVGAAKAGSSVGGRAIAIGEDMEGRVIPTAKKLGADWYKPPQMPPSQWMDTNRRWINERMDEGCKIFDCGAAPGRAKYPDPTSPYYQMERDEITKRGYPTTRVDAP